jgi:hypothetical protein
VTQYLIEEALDASLTLHERRLEAEAEQAAEQQQAISASQARRRRIQEAGG